MHRFANKMLEVLRGVHSVGRPEVVELVNLLIQNLENAIEGVE